MLIENITIISTFSSEFWTILAVQLFSIGWKEQNQYS